MNKFENKDILTSDVNGQIGTYREKN